jgi:MFS family permease
MLGVLRNRNFLFLWLAQVFSQTAQQMINYVLLQQAFALSNGSSTAVSGIIISFTLPAILLSAIAGVYVDRQPKRRVLIATNVLRGAMMLAYIFFTGHEFAFGALTVLYLTTLVFAGVSQFFTPAEGAAIPLLVKRTELIAANSLFNLTFTASQLIGFLILGPIIFKLLVGDSKNFGPFYIPLLILYLGCAVLTWLLPKNEQVEPSTNGDGTMRARIDSAVEELKEGWAYIRADQAIFGAIIQWSIAIAVLMMLGVIGPGFVTLELGLKPEDLYILLCPGGIGLVLGVILVSRYATEQNRLRMINYALLGAGVGLLIFASIGAVVRFIVGLVKPGADQATITATASPLLIVLMMILIFILGGLNSFVSVPAQTTLQERAREDIRARVFSAFFTVSNVVLIIPLLIVGPLADLLGLVLTVGLIGAAVIGAAYWGIRRGLDLPPSLASTEPTPPHSVLLPSGDALNSSAGVTSHQGGMTPLNGVAHPVPEPAGTEAHSQHE